MAGLSRPVGPGTACRPSVAGVSEALAPPTSIEGRERLLVAATEVALSFWAISQETGHEPAQHRVDVLPADVELAGDLNGQVST
jgi:hypothetical protein